MTYCDLSDLLKMMPPAELAELTAESGDEPDETVVAEAIAKADAELDAYLAGRYRLPLTETPPQVKSLSLDLAIYHLYSRRGVMPEVRRDRYRDAVAFLKEVAAGRARLEGAGGEPAGTLKEVAEVKSTPRTFSRGSQEDW